jgi:hypothetical protein
MVGRAGAKAGLIGAGVAAALTVLTLLLGGPSPILGRVGGGLVLLTYVGVGVLAAFFLTAPRSARMEARAGLLGGLIGGAGSGIVWVIAALVRMTQVSWDGWVPIIGLREMPSPANVGLTPGALGALIGGLCFLTSLVAGAGLGAIGGAVFGAARRD